MEKSSFSWCVWIFIYLFICFLQRWIPSVLPNFQLGLNIWDEAVWVIWVLPSKAHQCLVKADYRGNGAHINVNSVPEKLFKLLLFTSSLLSVLCCWKVGARPCLLPSPFVRLRLFTHFIPGSPVLLGAHESGIGHTWPCTTNGARWKMKVPVTGPPASLPWDSRKGEAPLWDSIPSSVKRGVRLDHLCGPSGSNNWWSEVFSDSLTRPRKPRLILESMCGGRVASKDQCSGTHASESQAHGTANFCWTEEGMQKLSKPLLNVGQQVRGKRVRRQKTSLGSGEIHFLHSFSKHLPRASHGQREWKEKAAFYL